ncbi:hypothetical protein PanWU01x14_313920 [Parasponia andersonii]|uniref:Transmembrane protein n=1 Tax=Parasponia andersonii TaxID=3476 RepID=A0A2P5ANV5_PARAD|nr:hypothetical protein PanWU01x14_313920 [Parasponia andersonii]
METSLGLCNAFWRLETTFGSKEGQDLENSWFPIMTRTWLWIFSFGLCGPHFVSAGMGLRVLRIFFFLFCSTLWWLFSLVASHG